MRRLQLFSFALLALAGCSGGGDGDGGPVTPPPTPTIAIQASPATVSVARGASATTTVTLTRGGNYTGAVQLTTSTTLPSGVAVTFNPASLSSATTTSVATITASATATGGAVQIIASGPGVTNATANVTVEVPTPSITFTATPATASITQGASQNIGLTIERAGGFTGAVTVAATGLPTGVTAPNVTIAAGATTGTMVLTASATAPAVSATAVTLAASGTGVTTQNRTVTLTVTSATANGFSLTAVNPALSITAGQTRTTDITLNRTGTFTGAVALTVDGAPAGVTATVAPTSIATGANSATLSVVTTAAAVPSTFNLTITGAGTGVTPNPTTTVAVTIAAAPGISVATSQPTVTTAAGTSGGATITLTRLGGFTGDVALTTTGAPAGVTPTFSPATLTAATPTSALSFTVASTVAPNTYPIVVSASGALPGGGTTNAQVTVNLTVTAAQSYTMAASAVTLQQGGTGTSTVTITRAGGFTGAVNLAATNLPSGVTATFNPAAPTGNTSTVTFTATAGATTGAFTGTITGTATGLANVTTTVAGTVTATGGGSGNVTARFCDATEYPLWVAYRSGTTGAWTRATAGANQTYSFSITGVGGMAWAKPDGNNGFAVTVYYGSAQELTTYGLAECTNNPESGKTLNGTFAGLSGALQSGQVSIGGAFAQSTFGQNGFNLTGVAQGNTDLIAFRASTTINGSSVAIVPDKGILRRNVNYASGSTIPVIDFNSSEAFSPGTAQVTVTNPSGGLLTVIATFQTGNGTFGGFSFGNLTGGSGATNTVYGLPSNLTQAGDFHLVQATSTVIVNNLPVSSRSVTLFNRNLGDKSITLGPDLAITGSGLVTIATAPYARLRVSGSWQSDYGDMLFGTFSQTVGGVNRYWGVSATRAYFAGASTYEVEMPDFSGVAGFDNNWGLRAGTSVSFGAIAYSAGGATATTEGLTVRSAAVYGTRTP
ncbi:MAG TPA: hypothetical protein VGE27_05665 [Gemmatimonas sp.]|uniref:beta strand repeat-containing protein n=1 Tax=Gemmatimonas sp. TaxID=1962908 RepID=UPI002ED8089A